MHPDASTSGWWCSKTAQTSTCDRAKPRDFLEVKKPKEVGFFFFPKGVGDLPFSKKVGGGGEAGAQIPVGGDGSRGRGSGRGQAVQVNRAAAGEGEEDEGRMGRVRKRGINHRGRGQGGRSQVAWSGFGSHTQKRAPPPNTHTLPLTHCPGGRRNPRSWGKTLVLPRCVCARVLFLHTPHPTPPPNPVTPSLLLLRLWRRHFPRYVLGEVG